MANDKPTFDYVDCPDEDFNKWLSTAPMGETRSAQNMLGLFFQQARKVKDDLVEKAGKEKDEKTLEQMKQAVYKLYGVLQRLENRILATDERLKHLRESLNITSLGNNKRDKKQ